MYSAITAFFSLSFIAFIFIQIGNFSDHYGYRKREYEQAQTYLNSDVCTNPRIIKAMGGNTKCSYYEKVMDKTPVMGAIFDTAEDIHICGNGYCSLLGHNITNSLPQIIITLGIIAVILLWASGIQLRRNRVREAHDYWSLPIGEHRKRD